MISGEVTAISAPFVPPRIFGVCEMCGKNIISWDDRGYLKYIFGDNLNDSSPIVNIRVAGTVRIQCTRKSCRRKFPEHWNTFSCFD